MIETITETQRETEIQIDKERHQEEHNAREINRKRDREKPNILRLRDDEEIVRRETMKRSWEERRRREFIRELRRK